VVGYFEVLDLIDENHEAIPISENGIKNLHNQLLKYSTKDEWQRRLQATYKCSGSPSTGWYCPGYF